MNKLSLSPRIIRALASMLREIRRCSFSSACNYQYKFNGYINSLHDLELITWGQWVHLSDLGMKVWRSALRMDSKRGQERFESLLAKISFVEAVQDDSPAEKVSAPAASPVLQLCRLSYVRYDTFSVVEELQTERSTFPRLSPRWAPLPGRRSLVGGEGQVRVSSGQASA